MALWCLVICIDLHLIVLQEEFGDELHIDKVGENSIKLFYDSDIFEYFMKSEQVQFWKKQGHPFVKLTSEECKQHIPMLGKIFLNNIAFPKLLNILICLKLDVI